MAARRQDKINEEIARELTSILRTVKDPRVSGAFISVTGADVSRDLSLARVYYSVLGSADGADKGLASAAGFFAVGRAGIFPGKTENSEPGMAVKMIKFFG